MKKYIVAHFRDKLCAQSAAMQIYGFSKRNSVSSKISSPISTPDSLYSLQFLLFGAALGYISGAVFSLFKEISYFDFFSVTGFITGAVLGVLSGTFIDLFLIEKREDTAEVTVEASSEKFYPVIKRLKKAGAFKIYFTTSDNL